VEKIMSPIISPDTESDPPPAIPESRFTRMLIDANGLNPDEFKCWTFCPGMLFNSLDKWWGDRGLRDFPHEGIDLCQYEDTSGTIRRLDHTTRIPLMHDGVVRAMFKDYLGYALIIEHTRSADIAANFLTVYAHTEPIPGIEVGCGVEQGDVIATIADTSHSKAKILPHLHFSLGLPSDNLFYEGFVWNIMRDPERVILLDPLAVIDRPHNELDVNRPECQKI
jgi:hypothetical protein